VPEDKVHAVRDERVGQELQVAELFLLLKRAGSGKGKPAVKACKGLGADDLFSG
jgi:hypothetical protein